jgi:hypothetical protein
VREESLSGVRQLDVDTGGTGGIHVRGANRGDVRLRARILAYARTDADARDLVDQSRLTTSGGRIRVDTPRPREDENVAVSFELEIPRDADIVLNTRNGGIRVEEFRGRADARTVNGGLSFTEVGGDIRGETVNGGISIALEGSRWEGAGLDVKTRNGGVSMRMPSDYSAELDASTVNGGIAIDFPIVVQGRLSRLNRSISTTLGSGGAPLRVRTTNGGVRIVRR